ncbi:putative reticulon nogo receptor [Trypoxylus dichotomus]
MQTLTLLVILIISTCTSALVASRNDKEKKDRIKDHLQSHNPCSTDNKQAPMHCFCNPDNRPGNASKIECWIFGTDLSEDYFLWTYFSTQPKILDMTVKVVQSGIFPFIPTKALEHLKLLRTFTVTYGSIEKIHPYAFANLTQLQNLDLTRCQIVMLQRHSFAYLPNLTELNLNENRISELHKDVFFHLPNLQKFYISQNNLSLIQEGTFKELTRLLELDLSSNYISVLTNYTFTGLSELKKLDLNNNSIRMLGDLTFAELWVLEVSYICFIRLF